jgi:pimeloyl-ACP methyl ester carboxylesterase
LSFLLLFFLFAAIVTRTFIQGFGVLFVICICMFVVPTPFVRPPGPLSPGIREALWFTGVQWLGVTPARLVAMALLALGFWLVYRRRRLAAARVLMAITVCVTLLLVLLPMQLAPWRSTFAAQKAFGSRLDADPAAAADITLRNTRVCFIAARRAEISTDGAFLAATHGLALWDDEELGYVGTNSVAFVTSIEPRGLPLDWRVKLNYAQADYTAGSARLASLRPARYLTDDNGRNPLTHAWMLPESTLQQLQGAMPRLELNYSLSLLKPRDYRLPTDGAWHELPDPGICRATPKPGNHIDVECFSAFPKHAQLSAQLNDIPATRVYSGVEFTPGWARWPYTGRVKLRIGSSRLARHDSITVTAWDVTTYFDKSLAMPGILGADLETCPLPASGTDISQQARWRDVAPHESNSIGVDDGVQLEVLDFGGSGSPIVLLPGLGATAHAFDDLAPLLTQKHRVIAITRRGSGYSSKPDFGFDTARLGQDVLAVMDRLGMQKVLLVGHSIAGDELTWLGGHHPNRFSGLVYLDAAYDRSGDDSAPVSRRLREINRSLPPEPPIPTEALLNYDTMSKFLLERGHTRYPEGELIAFLNVDKPFLAGTPAIDARTQQAIQAAIQSPDYRAVKVPALAVYAIENPDRPLPPWYDTSDPKLHALVAERARLMNDLKRENIEQFRQNVAQGHVLELQGATHNLIQSNQQEVLLAIERFAAEPGIGN